MYVGFVCGCVDVGMDLVLLSASIGADMCIDLQDVGVAMCVDIDMDVLLIFF